MRSLCWQNQGYLPSPNSSALLGNVPVLFFPLTLFSLLFPPFSSFSLCFPLFTSASLFLPLLPSFYLCFPLFPTASLFSLFFPYFSPSFFPLFPFISFLASIPWLIFFPLPNSANWAEYIPLNTSFYLSMQQKLVKLKQFFNCKTQF